MKKLFILLAACMMAASMMAQEQQVVYVQSPQLVRSGNTYYYGSHEVMNKRQMLDWYAQHNCQAAYDEFAKGYKTAKAGWALLGIGLGLDVGSIVSSVLYITNPTNLTYRNVTLGLALGALAFEIACIPTIAVGYSKMHSSVDVYNVTCSSTAHVRPSWTLQASSNGLGLAMKF